MRCSRPAPGNYSASYAVDTTPPVISSVAVSANASTATVTWTTDEAATSQVTYGVSPECVDANRDCPGL